MTNTTPIRKPDHKQKFGLSSYRRIARLANARVLACGSKYYLFEGLPTDFDAIRKSLVKLAKTRHASNQSILEIARLTCQFSELSNSFLNVAAQNLNRWEARLRHSKSNRVKNKSRKAELQEIVAISERLQYLADLQKYPNVADTPQFILLPPEEKEFDSITAQHVANFDEFRRLVLRIVFWFRGPDHTREFLTCLRTLNRYHAASINELERIRDRMQQMLRHKRFVNRETAICELEQDELFQKTAKTIRKRQKWKGFNRSKSFAHNLSAAIKLYTRTINKNRYSLDDFAPINIATHFITTENAAEFPSVWIDQFVQSEFKLNIEGRARFANQYQHRRGYRLLMPWLHNASMPQQVRFLRHCVGWLEKGATNADMEFACQIWPHTRFGSHVSLRRLRIATTRLAELFDWNIAATSEFIAGLLRQPFRMETIDALIHCLRRFPKHLVPDVRDRLIGVLTPFLLNEFNSIRINTKPFETAIVDWSAKWHDNDPRMQNEVDLPKRLRLWSRRLARFQTQNDQDAMLPNSISKLLNTADNRNTELLYLRRMSEEGQLTDRMKQRLDLLELPNRNKDKHISKAIRATQSACLVEGIEALRNQLTQVARRSLQIKFRISPPESTSLNDLVVLGGWADGMTAQDLNLFRETVDTWQQFGDVYKNHLDFNQRWISKARSNGLDLTYWLRPVEQQRVIKKKKLRMFISKDPYQIYSMGNLFNTCLSHGGCNEMSVLSNAAHANKQVIFVADDRNRLVARKLIAISDQFKLLGYHNYSVFVQDQQQVHSELVEWLSVYCLKLARDVGVLLGDEGEPESISGHFWYDDGAIEWPEPVDLACGTVDCAPSFVPERLLPPMYV